MTLSQFPPVVIFNSCEAARIYRRDPVLTGEVITKHFLEAHGLTYNDVKVSFVGYSDSVNQMKDGHAIAFGLNTQAPAGAVMDLAAARPIKLFEQADVYDKMLKLNPSYKLITL
ncbi:MAG: hypothetical protein HC767_13600, partial [Akkermansiaceae bacterium]|nr:hypothetical protein [Akkermansiaceae bacterium]